MPAKNLCVIEGHLGANPELRTSKANKPFCTFSVGVTGKAMNGEKETSWFKCICFGERAQMVASTFTKGMAIHCEGPVKLETYKGKDGMERSNLQLTAFEVHPVERTENPPQQHQQQQKPKAMPQPPSNVLDELPF